MIVQKVEYRKLGKPCPSVILRERKPAKAQAGHPAPESASLMTKFGRLRKELTAWVKKGAPRASKEVRAQRLSICEACEYYKEDGNFGLGECMAPGCNCSRVKLWLGSSRCPLNPPKWLPVVPQAKP